MDKNQPLYVISIAAELVGMHPQTLRLYERIGLIKPRRKERPDFIQMKILSA